MSVNDGIDTISAVPHSEACPVGQGARQQECASSFWACSGVAWCTLIQYYRLVPRKYFLALADALGWILLQHGVIPIALSGWLGKQTRQCQENPEIFVQCAGGWDFR